MVVEDTTRVKDYLNKTKLEALDYVINPYVGCPNKCLYCYAAYMSSFSKHSEEWGEFIDVKRTSKKINIFKIKNKKVMISTVTDPYNSYEEKYPPVGDYHSVPVHIVCSGMCAGIFASRTEFSGTYRYPVCFGSYGYADFDRAYFLGLSA